METPTPVKSRALEPVKVKMLGVGRAHTIILTEDRMVLAVGMNELGQLGNGDPKDQITPVPITIEGLRNKNIVSIACGLDHNFAITEQGTVWAWYVLTFQQLTNSEYSNVLVTFTCAFVC